jgi:hypothetical protein
VGSAASVARQGIAWQCSERGHDDLMSGPHEDVEKENKIDATIAIMSMIEVSSSVIVPGANA